MTNGSDSDCCILPCSINHFVLINRSHRIHFQEDKEVTLNEYQVAAQRTSNTKNQAEKIDNALLGLSGEVGELCDAMKKHLFQGHKFDHNQMVREAGDVLWYIAELACGLGITLDEIACCNIEKLRARYPDGFNREKSMHRMEGDI